jgi:hypothetical protein
VIGSVLPSEDRPDVAAAEGTARDVGFHFGATIGLEETVSLYLLAEDGRAYPVLGSQPTGAASIVLPDGRVVPTATTAIGHVDQDRTSVATVAEFQWPVGVLPADYDSATLIAGADDIGPTEIVLTDAPGVSGHGITAQTLPDSGVALTVPVASCLQWSGYTQSRPLYVVQKNGSPITTVILSKTRE